MKLAALFLITLLLFGCMGNEGQQNESMGQNETLDNQPNETTDNTTDTLPEPVILSERFTEEQFSFEYPLNMVVQHEPGIFAADHVAGGQTTEILAVVYLNTTAKYGANQDRIFKSAPSKAATTLLEDDLENDPVAILGNATDVSSITEFSIVRDAFVSQVSFKKQFAQDGPIYSGYALSVYVPERSLHLKVRIVALNPQIADDLKNQFLLSFRLE